MDWSFPHRILRSHEANLNSGIRSLLTLGIPTANTQRQRQTVHQPALEQRLPTLGQRPVDYTELPSSSQAYGKSNQEIKINIRLRINNENHRTWDRDLPAILFGLRRRQNAATGQTPSHLMLGWTLPRPGDWWFQDPENHQREERQIREERVKQRQTSY